jgi:GntR family transcriptional repressor for pyruvate dehydrogenase complex
MDINQLIASKTHEEVAEALRQRIRVGEVALGSRLPNQRQLAATFGVSRHSIRAALLTLEDEGLVETRRGATGGSFVTTPQLNARGIRRWVRTHLVDLDDICDYRIAVEQKAAELAAVRRTPDDLASMWQAIEALPSGQVPTDVFREADGRFHAAIARAARNPRLEQAIRKARSDLFIPADSIELTHEVEKTREQHTLIFEAIRDRDPVAAVEQVVAHIEDTRSMMHNLLSGRL